MPNLTQSTIFNTVNPIIEKYGLKIHHIRYNKEADIAIDRNFNLRLIQRALRSEGFESSSTYSLKEYIRDTVCYEAFSYYTIGVISFTEWTEGFGIDASLFPLPKEYAHSFALGFPAPANQPLQIKAMYKSFQNLAHNMKKDPVEVRNDLYPGFSLSYAFNPKEALINSRKHTISLFSKLNELMNTPEAVLFKDELSQAILNHLNVNQNN